MISMISRSIFTSVTRHHAFIFSFSNSRNLGSYRSANNILFRSRKLKYCSFRYVQRKIVPESVKASAGEISNKTVRKTRYLAKFLNLAKPEKWNITGAVLLLFLSSTVTMAVPFCIGRIVDIMMTSQAAVSSNLVTTIHILVAAFAIGAAANFGRIYLINMSSHRIVNQLREKAYASILRQETAYFDTAKTGDLLNRLSADTAAVGMCVTNYVSDGLRSLCMLSVSSSLMVYTSPRLAFLGLVTVAPVALLAVYFRKTLINNSRNVQDSLAKATQVAEERISNIRTFQAFLKIKEEKELFKSKINAVLLYASKESASKAIFFTLNGFSGNLIMVSVLYFGGQMMSENLITIGSLSAFCMYAAYAGISISGISTFFSSVMQGLGASSRVWEIIDREPLIPMEGGLILPKLNGDISFDNVSFIYPSRPKYAVLSDFSLQVPAGSVYALVGPSGCGKSTVGSLLLRLYDCQSGSVSVDGVDVKSLNLQWLRKNIAIVSQDPVLFSFSIRDNIKYGAPEGVNVNDEMLEDVLFKANALDFVRNMPDGLNTVVGERGATLSGGQRQRIAIARALLKDPKILILDEATSSLDAESEFSVQEALEDLMKNRTVITIAHRLSTVKNADVIVVLENGRVIEKGNYSDLLVAGGPFCHLVQRQSLRML